MVGNCVTFTASTFEFAQQLGLVEDCRTIVFCYPTLDFLCDSLCESYPKYFRKGLVCWDHFPDGTPNFEFENPEHLRGKNIVFLFDFRTLSNVTEQYCLVSVLPRQNIRRLDIVVPFFGPATMERVDREGVLAAG